MDARARDAVEAAEALDDDRLLLADDVDAQHRRYDHEHEQQHCEQDSQHVRSLLFLFPVRQRRFALPVRPCAPSGEPLQFGSNSR